MEVNNVKLHTCSIAAINSNKRAKQRKYISPFTHLIRGRGHAMELLVFLIQRSWGVKTPAQSGVHLSAPPFSDNKACISSFQAITARPVWDISSSPLFFLYIPYPVATQFGSNCLLWEIFFTSFSKKTQQEENTLHWKCGKSLLC